MTPLERKLKMIAIAINIVFFVALIILGSYIAGYASGRAYERRNINSLLEKYYEQNEKDNIEGR